MNTTIKNRQGKLLSVHVHGLDNAPAIVFLNSLGTDHNMWEAQVDALKHQFTVISFDTRGHGVSDVIAATNLRQLADDVVDILDVLKIAKAHVCGISMGGITALALAVHYPKRLHSITVANSAAKIGTAESWLSRAASVEANGLGELVATTHTRWFSQPFDYLHNPLAQRTIRSLANTPAAGYASACRALASADLREQIHQISIPTLIIAGAFDPVTTVQDAEFMQQQITGSQLKVLDASHLSNIEQPQAFSRELIHFIKNIQSLT